MKYFKAELFKKTIADRKITLTKLEELTGISRVSLSGYKNGKTQPPIESILKIARVLCVSFAILIDDTLGIDSVNLDLQSKNNTTLLENLILKTMKKYCKKCENINPEIPAFSEKILILSEAESRNLEEFRRQHGTGFEKALKDETEASSDSKGKKRTQNQPGCSEVG